MKIDSFFGNVTWICFQTVEQFSVEEIEQRLALLDEIMEIELREVQNRFQSKRKPILDAIKLKKQTQTHH